MAGKNHRRWAWWWWRMRQDTIVSGGPPRWYITSDQQKRDATQDMSVNGMAGFGSPTKVREIFECLPSQGFRNMSFRVSISMCPFKLTLCFVSTLHTTFSCVISIAVGTKMLSKWEMEAKEISWSKACWLDCWKRSRSSHKARNSQEMLRKREDLPNRAARPQWPWSSF